MRETLIRCVQIHTEFQAIKSEETLWNLKLAAENCCNLEIMSLPSGQPVLLVRPDGLLVISRKIANEQ